MTGTLQETYTPHKWAALSGLQGISDHTLEVHFGLYEGYVKNANLLNEQLSELADKGKAAGSDPAFAELTRRLGFEVNGMRLHEYYFDNLTAAPTGAPTSGALYEALGKSFGSVERWQKDFTAVGGLRGVGWAIAFQDPTTGLISNNWVTLHQDGNLAGFVPILVMDVWEHAYMLDYKPADRGKYIEAFLAGVDWKRAEARLQRVAGRG
jgi:Fe-Mn family superoxide dismutase